MSTTMKKLLRILAIASVAALVLCTNAFAAKDAVGDLNRDGVKDENDAIYLLNNVIFGEFIDFDIDQPSDYDGNGVIDENDAVYLLNNVIFGEFTDAFHICDHPESWSLVEVVAPDCKNGGYTLVRCQCGKEARILPTAKTNDHDFDWENPDLTHQATCLDNGYITAACTVCGEIDTLWQNATGNHDWQGGDCESGAECSGCDAVLPATGHRYSAEPTFVQEATCEGGYKEYECENPGCDAVHREDLAPTDHRFAENAWVFVGLRETGVDCHFVYAELPCVHALRKG